MNMFHSSANGNQDLPLFHDWLWSDLKFRYETKQIILKLSSPVENTEIAEIMFDDVIAYNMICCELWGKSPHIDCITVIKKKNCNIFNQVLSAKGQYDFTVSCLKSEDDYIEVKVSGISGDQLTVVCENIRVVYKL